MKILIALIAFCGVVQAFYHKRIVGGHHVEIYYYPYQVSVRYRDVHVCGGSIINAKTILTAAHCVHNKDHTQYSIRVGNSTHTNGQLIQISHIIEHDEYEPDVFDNDMAVMKPAIDIPFSQTVQPIPLQPLGVEVPSGTTAWVSGWGALTEDDDSTPSHLRAVDVRVIPDQICGQAYGDVINSHMLCAQAFEKDACQGDSGGPLVAKGNLIGVVSWGYGCARPEYPGVYAKVSNMYNWINANSL